MISYLQSVFSSLRIFITFNAPVQRCAASHDAVDIRWMISILHYIVIYILSFYISSTIMNRYVVKFVAEYFLKVCIDSRYHIRHIPTLNGLTCFLGKTIRGISAWKFFSLTKSRHHNIMKKVLLESALVNFCLRQFF